MRFWPLAKRTLGALALMLAALSFCAPAQAGIIWLSPWEELLTFSSRRSGVLDGWGFGFGCARSQRVSVPQVPLVPQDEEENAKIDLSRVWAAVPPCSGSVSFGPGSFSNGSVAIAPLIFRWQEESQVSFLEIDELILSPRGTPLELLRPA